MKTSGAFGDPPGRLLEIDPDRCLHNAGRTRRAGCAEGAVGLRHLTQRSRSATRRIRTDSGVSQYRTCRASAARRQSTNACVWRPGKRSVDVSEIRAVEKIVHLPTQLNAAPLT